MTTVSFTVRIVEGLHARPAASFVKLANSFPCDLYLVGERDGRKVNAKSIMGILMLGLHRGETATLIADGANEQEAVKALQALCERAVVE